MKPYEFHACDQYGAQMGRRSHPLESFDVGERVHLARVRLTGDYDKGGAYWGGGPNTLPLYCAWDCEGNTYYLRAVDRSEARAVVALHNSAIRFYR